MGGNTETVDDIDRGSESFRRRSQALGDPTRHALYRWMALVSRPVAVAELVEQFGLNHNTVRQHLAKLRTAELITEQKALPDGPGRPRLLYRLTAEAAADWNDEAPYQRLALMLLEVAAGDATPEEVGVRVGRALGIELPDEADPIAMLVDAMAEQGFAPRVERHGAGVDVVLDHCPFAAAAEEYPEVVCALHRGMAMGTAEAVGGVQKVTLSPKPPRRAGCRLELTIPKP